MTRWELQKNNRLVFLCPTIVVLYLKEVIPQESKLYRVTMKWYKTVMMTIKEKAMVFCYVIKIALFTMSGCFLCIAAKLFRYFNSGGHMYVSHV